jgi:hypothetical protein
MLWNKRAFSVEQMGVLMSLSGSKGQEEDVGPHLQRQRRRTL